jgi:hypothetical protein
MTTIGFVLTMVIINLISIIELRIWYKKKLWKIDRLEIYFNALANQVNDNDFEFRCLYKEFHNYKNGDKKREEEEYELLS